MDIVGCFFNGGSLFGGNAVIPVGLITDLFNLSGQFAVAELGQSNMEGRNGADPLHSVENGTAYEWNGSSLIHLTNDRGGASGGSHSTYFADRIFSQVGKKPVMIECAAGGAGFGEESESSGTNHWGASGALRGLAKTKIDSCLSELETTGLIGLWCGGERDAQEIDDEDASPYTKASAKTAFQDILAWWFTNYPNSVFLISELGDFSSGLNSQGWQDVRALQNECSSENERVHIAFSGAKDFHSTGKMFDSLHYNFLGNKDMGEAFADKIIELILT